MKYYIYEKGLINKANSHEYDLWLIKESGNYRLNDYTIIIDETFYSVETIYAGDIEDDEEPLPFVLCRLEATLTVFSDGVGFMKTIDEVDYFYNFEELQNRYFELISKIKSNFA